jgi:putative copper export protein
MVTWCAILFILGVLAFLDVLFTPPYGDIFIKVDSLLFMMISLGMLIRLRAEKSQHKVKSSVQKTQEVEKRETPVGVEN